MIYVNSTNLYKSLQYNYSTLHNFRHNATLIICISPIDSFRNYFLRKTPVMRSAKNIALRQIRKEQYIL